MTEPILIRDLFVSDVTRDIPPVVYFHEQSPAKLQAEVSEYIITGGWPEGHPNHSRVPRGIHEEFVRLLSGISAELDKPGGPELPNAWISGFYGSGKSSFAKLLGLALDGAVLPDGTLLADALLLRDTSPLSEAFHQAWNALRRKISPVAVVFDIGGIARDNEQVHSAAIRQVQKRLGYCSTEPLVADFELGLERDGEWGRFLATAEETLGNPWKDVKDRALAEEDFSLVMSVMFPGRYTDPMSWYTSRAGTHTRSESPDDAATAIRDMLKFRSPGSTLFLVIDEVSQYVLSINDRVDRLRAFASAIGATLKGKVWLVALGQQKLDAESDDTFLVWAKDRFPPSLRVHLAATNIRDVVHKRLLQKKPQAETELRLLFDKHRADLKLFAYGCESVTSDEFVEVYPMLPGQIDLILQLTSALRVRSARAQGDDQAIRGLLQLLGELFRDQKLADMPVGALVTLDQIYEVQHTALDSDIQASMARILNQTADDGTGLLARVAKAVALLELIQDTVPTDARLVAQCLYDRVDRGSQLSDVTGALDELRRRNLLGYSEKQGYKIQSSAGEEWERERREGYVPREGISEIAMDALKLLLADPDRPKLQGRPFPWAGFFSDGRQIVDAVLADPRDDASFRVDFRLLSKEERLDSAWIRRSAEAANYDRLLWLTGDTENFESLARELGRSRAMVKRYKPRRESLNPARKLLLQQEENRTEDLERSVRDAVTATWMDGTFYYRGRALWPQEQGTTFSAALQAAATRLLPDLYPQFVSTQIQPAELMQLVESELTGPSPKFLETGLGILALDAGRYVPSNSGVVPQRVLGYVDTEGGLGGTQLIAYFGGPPFGYTANVVKACVAGLLRDGKLRIQPESGTEITAVRDAGLRDLFDRDRAFRRASYHPAGDDDIGFQARARICKFFEQQLKHPLDREDNAIADAVATHFPELAERLRDVLARLSRLPDSPATPAELVRLGSVLEEGIRKYRQTKPTVKHVKKHLDALRDGVVKLAAYDVELTPDAIQVVRTASDLLKYEVAQIEELDLLATNVDVARTVLASHLASDCPWHDIASFKPDIEAVRAVYVSERRRLLGRQEEKAEQARSRVQGREGFSTLTADQSHVVLRPIAQAVTDTTAEAIFPTLKMLKDGFALDLLRAEERANELLDEILSEGSQPLIVKIDLALRHRELTTEQDVDALVEEIRDRLVAQIRQGMRVRLT